MPQHVSEFHERTADDRFARPHSPTSNTISIESSEQHWVQHDFERSWRDLQRRAFFYRLVIFSYVPVISAVTILLNHFPDVAPDHFGAWITAVWLVGLAVVGIYRQDFRCPRCAGFFFRRLFDHDPSIENCVHCGLARGAMSGIDDDQH